MKKLSAILLAALLTFSLAACGAKDENSGGENKSGSPVELLTAVWDSYGEEDKFPAVGGDMTTEDTTKTDAPGKFSIKDTEALDSTLGFPADSVKKIDDAASLVHMMNANTFTCGAFHLKNGEDVNDVFAAIKNNIMNRHWLCGFPDRLVIIQVDDNIVTLFGAEELVDTFSKKIYSAYQVKVLCDEPIA